MAHAGRKHFYPATGVLIVALSSFVGDLVLNISTGSQSVTGVGFEPKIIFFFTTRGTADGVAVHGHRGVGCAVSSTSEWHAASGEEDGQANSDAQAILSTDVCMEGLVYGTSTVEYACDFTTMDADGFTFNVSNAPGSAFRVGYLALGGADLTNVFLGSLLADNATGTQAITGVGFEPECVLLVGTNEDDALDSIENHANISVGFASSASLFAATATSGRNNVATSVNDRAQVTDACINTLNRDGSVVGKADLASFDADGFTLDWSDAIDEYFLFACLAGGQYHVGSFTTQTSTGEFSETGVGFQPTSGMFLSWCNVASASPTTGSENSWGVASSSTERWVVGAVSEDAAETTNVDQFSEDGLMYQNYDHAQTQEGAVDFVSNDADGFTFNQTDADPTAGNEVVYLAFGSDPAAGGVDPIALITQIPGTISIAPARDFVVRLFERLRPRMLGGLYG